MMRCIKCGDDLIGDGYSIPFHCVNAVDEAWLYNAPDSGVYLCDFEDEYEG